FLTALRFRVLARPDDQRPGYGARPCGPDRYARSLEHRVPQVVGTCAVRAGRSRGPHRCRALVRGPRTLESRPAAVAMTDQWHGWPVLPPVATAGTAWVELSHSLRADLGRIPFLPRPRFERIMTLSQDRLNVTEIQMVCHFGTHVDAPCHFIPGAPAFHEIPL